MKLEQYIGVDISERSIDLLELDGDGNVKACASSACPKAMLENGMLASPEAMCSALRKLVVQSKVRPSESTESTIPAFVSIPESMLYVHYLKLPANILSDGVLKYISETISGVFPMPLEEMYWQYKLSTRGDVRYGTIVGAQKNVVRAYVDAFRAAGIEPYYLSSSFFGLGQLLFEGHDVEMTIVVDVNERVTHIGIFDIDTVADMTVQVLWGLEKEVEQTKDDPYKGIVHEIERAKEYFEQTFDSHIERIIMIGESDHISELANTITERIGVQAKIADISAHVKDTDALCTDSDTSALSRAFGLAKLASVRSTPELNLLDQFGNKSREDHGFFGVVGIALPLNVAKSLNKSTHWAKTYIKRVTAQFAAFGKTKTHKNYALLLTAFVTIVALMVLVYVLTIYI